MPSKNNSRKSNRSRRFTKFKLLLDEGLPSAKSFPKVNNFYNVKHITHDLGYTAVPDSEVYKIAEKQFRIIVVFNTKDFKPLIKLNKPTVISLTTNLSNKEADLKICKALREISENQRVGCWISISKSGITLKQILGSGKDD